MGFTETSAKESTNVEIMFQEAIGSIIRKGIKCPVKSIRLEMDKSNKNSPTDSSCCG
jgi:hypothetical protein